MKLPAALQLILAAAAALIASAASVSILTFLITTELIVSAGAFRQLGSIQSVFKDSTLLNADGTVREIKQVLQSRVVDVSEEGKVAAFDSGGLRQWRPSTGNELSAYTSVGWCMDALSLGFTIGAISTLIPVVLINRTPEFKSKLLEYCFLVVCGLLVGFPMQAMLIVLRLLSYISIGYQHYSYPTLAFYGAYVAFAMTVLATVLLMKSKKIVECGDFDDSSASWIRSKFGHHLHDHSADAEQTHRSRSTLSIKHSPLTMSSNLGSEVGINNWEQSSDIASTKLVEIECSDSDSLRSSNKNRLDGECLENAAAPVGVWRRQSSELLAGDISAGLVSEEHFLQLIERVYPELVYFTSKSVVPSPEISAAEGQLWRMERNRTVGAMLCAFWLYTDDYEAFTRRQRVDGALSKESWNETRRWARDCGLICIESISAMLSFTSFHDICKIASICKNFGGGLANHDASLGVVMDTYSDQLPSFGGLPTKFKTYIRNSVRMDFNFCQFVQGESVPANLTSAKEFIEKHGMDAFNFYIFHCFLDVAGALGHVSLKGSLTMNENLYRSFTDARNAILESLQGSGQERWEERAYKSYLQTVARRLGLNSDTSLQHTFALARLCCLARCSTAKEVRRVSVTLSDELTVGERSELIGFLNASGLPAADEEEPATGIDTTGAAFPNRESHANSPHGAIQIVYAPAILVESAKNESVGLDNGLRILLHIYRLARRHASSTASPSHRVVVEVISNKAAEYVKSYRGSPSLAVRSLDFSVKGDGEGMQPNKLALKVNMKRYNI